MTRTKAEDRDRLASDIRRQIADPSTTRCLRALPAFRAVEDLPDHLKVLLDRLDARERQPQHGGRR